MPAHQGRALLVEIGDGASPPNFIPLAGLRTRSVSFSAGLAEATDADSPGGWRELLEGAGVRRLSVTGAGVFRDGAAADLARDAAFAQTARTLRLTVPGLGVLEGSFLVVNLDYAGDHDGEATYSLSLASAGAISFTAAA